MDEYFAGKVKARWAVTAADTDGGGVTATKAAVDGAAHSVHGIQASGDAAAIVTVESPASTILYRKRFAAAFTMSEQFEPGTLVGAENAAVLVKVSAGTANSEANMQGVSIDAE